jgi:hypothetical protein
MLIFYVFGRARRQISGTKTRFDQQIFRHPALVIGGAIIVHASAADQFGVGHPLSSTCSVPIGG